MAGLDGRQIENGSHSLFSLTHVTSLYCTIELEVRFCDSHCDASALVRV